MIFGGHNQVTCPVATYRYPATWRQPQCRDNDAGYKLAMRLFVLYKTGVKSDRTVACRLANYCRLPASKLMTGDRDKAGLDEMASDDGAGDSRASDSRASDSRASGDAVLELDGLSVGYD